MIQPSLASSLASAMIAFTPNTNADVIIDITPITAAQTIANST